jgi:hypothetical protein
MVEAVGPSLIGTVWSTGRYINGMVEAVGSSLIGTVWSTGR